jgi:multidrug efflux pump subunit AcrA (membrane-fusion protein)
MATIEYLHVCDYAFADQGGKPCIIGIFDVINAGTFPATHPVMAIAIRLRGTTHELLKLKIELARPSGDALATMQGEVTMGPDGSAFMQVNMASVTFPEPGRYVVKVSSDGKTLTSHSLQVQKLQPALQSAPPGSAPKQFH